MSRQTKVFLLLEDKHKHSGALEKSTTWHHPEKTVRLIRFFPTEQMNVYELRKSGGWNAILDAEILEHTSFPWTRFTDNAWTCFNYLRRLHDCRT